MSLRYLLILFAATIVSACKHGDCDIAATGMPPLLSATGCVNMADPAQPAAGTIPYDINEPFWSDGAEKWRYLSLPEDARIAIAEDGDFIFPVGTVLIKHFRLDGRFIETRFFIHGAADSWNGYSYRWNGEQTEAQLLENADEVDFGGQVWRFPGRDECQRCHTAAAGFSLGPEVAQLNREYSHAPAGTHVNQIDFLQALGVLVDVPHRLRGLELAVSRDRAKDLNDRARSYLHSNCSHCHRPGGGTESSMDLRAGSALADTQACKVRPRLGTLGIAGAQLLSPGDHARSVLWSRMSRQDNSHMPPWFFNKVADEQGVQLIGQWIDSLASCN